MSTTNTPVQLAEGVDALGLFNPRFYKQITIHDFPYQKPIRIGLGLNDAIKDAWREIYREKCPDDLVKGDIDAKKYADWYDKHRDTREVKLAYLKLVFLPEAGSPTIDEIYDFFPFELYTESYDFFDGILADNTSEPQALASDTDKSVASSQEALKSTTNQ